MRRCGGAPGVGCRATANAPDRSGHSGRRARGVVAAGEEHGEDMLALSGGLEAHLVQGLPESFQLVGLETHAQQGQELE